MNPTTPEAIERQKINLIAIAESCKRADGSDIPLGEHCRKAAALIAALAAERDAANAALAGARRDALEEAAGIADNLSNSAIFSERDRTATCQRIATAIRNLGGTDA